MATLPQYASVFAIIVILALLSTAFAVIFHLKVVKKPEAFFNGATQVWTWNSKTVAGICTGNVPNTHKPLNVGRRYSAFELQRMGIPEVAWIQEPAGWQVQQVIPAGSGFAVPGIEIVSRPRGAQRSRCLRLHGANGMEISTYRQLVTNTFGR
jgi:hypothetical protein